MINQSTELSNQYIELLCRANELRQKREYRQAINIYNIIIARFGKSIDLIRILAICYFELGFYERDESNFKFAILLIKEAINLAPNDDQLHADLGQLYSLGILEYQESAQEYRVAIELNPNNIDALMGSAALYGVPEEVVTIDETIDWLERLVHLQPNDPNYHFRLGEIYYEIDQVEKATDEWLKALLCPKPLITSPAQTINKLIGTNNT